MEFEIRYTEAEDLFEQFNDPSTKDKREIIRQIKNCIGHLELETNGDKQNKIKVRQLKKKFKLIEKETLHDALFADVGEPERPDTQDKMIDHGRGIMADSKNSLNNTLKVLADTQTIANHTAIQLKDQTDKLQKIDDDISHIDSTLVRAGKHTKRIGRKLLSDKYLWCMIFLIVIAIVLVIYFKIRKN
jgi:uncharacterized protein YdiU (UPF0061 family)